MTHALLRSLVGVMLLLGLVSSGSAEDASTGAAQAAPDSAQGSDDDRRHGGSAWTGPRVELAYRIYALSDTQGGGAVSSACFSGFLPTRYIRAGGGLEAGGRAYDYGATEGLLGANVFAGYQHLHDLGRFVPFVVGVGELGVVFGKRFHTPVTRAIRGAGLELGANVNLVRTLYVGLGLSFMVYTMDGLAYDTFGLRLSIGL